MLLLVCWQQLLNNSDTQSLLTILFKVTLVLFFVVLFTRALRSGKHVWPECTYRNYRAPGPGNYRVSPLCRRISIIFSYFLLYPGIFFFFPFPRLCSSHRLLFQKVVRVLSYCAICVWPHLGVTSFFLFWISLFLFLGWRSRCAIVPRTFAFYWSALIPSRLWLISLSRSLTAESVSLWWRIRTDSGGAADFVG